MRIFILAFSLLFLSACATKPQPLTKEELVKRIGNIKDLAYDCDSPKAYIANILGHKYISDMGIKCLVGKRTLNQAVDLKKVYIHRIQELDEAFKQVTYMNKPFFLDKKFALAFYVYLKEELEDRGIVVLNSLSPYVMKVDAAFVNFKGDISGGKYSSKVWLDLSIKYNIKDKLYKINTYQIVDNFDKVGDTPFFTDLLMRQLANKTASVISAF